MGRRSKYTLETVKKITDAIKLGATYELACGYAGIHYDTFNEWRKKKSEFSDALKAAEGIAAVGWLAKIEKAASDGNWAAAAWKLERRYPEEYGRIGTPRGERTGIGVNVQVTVTLRALAERVAEEEGLDPAEVVAWADRYVREGIS